ncbi:MAG TPA: nitronate monooxygenase [Myxococcales bacterium]|jgi:nitronate monooxygenase
MSATSLSLPPIVLAPLGGGPGTAELAAAVSAAGALGFVGTAYMTPQQILDAARRVRELTDRPFGLNLFAGEWPRPKSDDPSKAIALLAPFHARLGLPEPSVPEVPPNPFPAQLEAVLQARPAAFSVTFGIPSKDEIDSLRARGIAVYGTATTASEAVLLAEAGVDGVIAQGAEAGGHRGTFAVSPEEGLIPTLRLVAEVRQAVKIPVLASGGIMDGRDLRAALDAGAVAAQIGTAFLGCPEAGTSPAYRAALVAAKTDRTALTRVFSGRLARGLRNQMIEAGERDPDGILPYPLQNQFTRPMRQAAAQKGDAGALSLWAGQGVARLRPMPAAQLVATLLQELQEA